MKRSALALCIVAFATVSPARGQEHVGSSQQAQTVAPSIDVPQPGSCGAAPSVRQINYLIPVVRRMFSQPQAFNATLATEISKTCRRNFTASYLMHLIAVNSWSFLPSPGISARYPPGPVACGKSASIADLNAVITKIKPLFAMPQGFDANIRGFDGQPCVGARATLYLFSVINDNNLALRP